MNYFMRTALICFTMAAMAGWIHAGKLKPVQDMVEGFEQMPEALSRLYDGHNVGVQCCNVRGEPR